MAKVEAWVCDSPACSTYDISGSASTPPVGWLKLDFSEVGGREKVVGLVFCSKECAGEFFHPRPKRGRPRKAV